MKRKWQRVLSWILTLTMLLGTFEGTGVGTLQVLASDTAEVVSIAANGDNFSATVEFDQTWDNWGVIVYDELGKTAILRDGEAGKEGTENEVSTSAGLSDYKSYESLNLDSFLTVQAFAFDGEYSEAAALKNMQGDAVTFNFADAKLNAKDIYVVNTAVDEHEIWGTVSEDTGWKKDESYNLPDGTNVQGGVLAEIIGSGHNIAPITFAAKQGGSSDIFANVEWTLVGGETKQIGDDWVFVPTEGLSVTAGTEENPGILNGLEVVKNDDGTVTISGTPDKVITSESEKPVEFRLIATKIGAQGSDTEAQKAGRYDMKVAFWPMVSVFNKGNDTPLEVQVTDKSEEPLWFANYYVPVNDYDNKYRKNTATADDMGFAGLFYANEGYEVKADSDKTNNTVVPRTFTVKNTSTITDMTNVSISIVDDGTYTYENGKWVLDANSETKDADKFELEGADAITTLKKNSKENSFVVKPIVGLEAQSDKDNEPIAYEAWLVINADQLPQYGLRLTKLRFVVYPSYKYTLKVGDEAPIDVDLQTKTWKFEGQTKNYTYIDLGTYQAANDVDDITLTVRDNDDLEKSTVKFVQTIPEVYKHLPGYEAGKDNTISLGGVTQKAKKIDISGYLKPETYAGDYAEDLNNFVLDNTQESPIFYEDETNGWTVYLIPLMVQDGDNNSLPFYGKLTVKPAGIEVAEVVSKTVPNILKDDDTVDWFGGANLVAGPGNKNTKTIKVKNTNKYPIQIFATIGENDGADNSLSSNIASLKDEGKDYITIPGNGEVSIVIGDASVMGTGVYNGKLRIYGTEAGNDGYVIDKFDVNLHYEALDTTTYKIVAPRNETESTEKDGTTLDKAIELKVGLGDTKTWNITTVGGPDVKDSFKLSQVGDVIEPNGSVEAIIVTDKLAGSETPVTFISNSNNDSTGLGSWGFSFTDAGQLRSINGPTKEGEFYICVSANKATEEDSVAAYSYYKVIVSKSTQAIVVSGIDDTETYGKAKNLEATAADNGNYDNHNYNLIADDYNFVINTTEASRESISKNVTIKNNTVTRIEGLYVTYETVIPGVFSWPATGTYKYALKDLARYESVEIPVSFVAPGVEEVDSGLYVQKITISANGVADKIFYVKANVKDAPYIVSFVQDKDYHRYQNNGYPEYDRAKTSNVPRFDAYHGNMIYGTKVAVGTEIAKGDIVLEARDSRGWALKSPQAVFTWEKTLPTDADITGEFALEADGNIVGKPTHPGIYYQTITVTDYTDADHPEYGYYDIVIVVPGSITPTVTTKGQNVVDNGVLKERILDQGYTAFDGVVQGSAASARRVFTILNTSDEKTMTGLRVSVVDPIDERFAGSKDHFAKEVMNDQTSIAPGETATFTIAPFNTSEVGDFIALVRIEANEIAPIEIPVIWYVVAPLTLIPPTTKETTVPVGQPFELTLVSEGGHEEQTEVWKALKENDDPDDTLLKKFAADMRELKINSEDFAPAKIKDHAVVITNGKLATDGGGVLKGAGTLPFTASSNVAEEKWPCGIIMVPEQYATEDITITINPTPFVYIYGTEDNTDDNLNVGRSTSEQVDEFVIRDKDGVKTDTISAFWKKTSFTYKTSSTDYDYTKLARTFTLKNDLTWKNASVDLQVSVNIIANGAESKDFELVAISNEKKAGQKFQIVKGQDVEITVRPADKLAKGTYTADLVIAGSGIETVTLPLSFTIEEATWDVAVTDHEGVLSDNVAIKQPLKRNDTGDNKPALIRVYATGNQPIMINDVVELDANGNPIADGATGQKLTINSISLNRVGAQNNPQTNPYVLSKGGQNGTAINPCADPENPGTEGDYYAEINVTVKDFKSLADTSSMLGIFYRNGEKNNDQETEVVEVKYVVYEEMNSKIKYTPSATVVALDKGDIVYEGYDPKDYAQEFTIDNGESGDLSKGLYYVKVSSSNINNFLVNGKEFAEIELIKAGEHDSVVVTPKAGLAAGNYDADITFTADNGAEHTATVTFIVTMDDDFTSTVRRDEQRLASGFNPRLFDTLKSMVGVNTDKYTVITRTVDGRSQFLIDMNPNTEDPDASRFDVFIAEADNGDIIIKKSYFTLDGANWKVQEKPTTDITQPTTSLSCGGDGIHKFKNIILTVEETITYKDARGGAEVVTWYVPYGGKIEDAEGFDAEKIALKNGNKALEGFVDEETDQGVETDDVITDDHNLVPVWHEHLYATNLEDPTSKVVSGNQVGVEWVWEEDGNGGYKSAKVFLTCISDKCKDPEKGVVSGNGKIGTELIPATCTQGGYTLYTATYLFQKNGISYMDYQKGNILDNGHGHDWSFDWDNVRWSTEDPEAVSANVIKTCMSVSHNTLVDGPKSVSVSADSIVFVGTEPTCTEPGSGYYVATFSDPDIPAADLEAKKNVVSQNVPEIPATGHKWTVSECTMEGSFEEGAKSAVLYLVCEHDASHTVSVNVTKDNITLVSQNEVSKTYRAQTIKDMQALYADFTFWNHTEHVYSVSWNWISVTSENAVVRAIFTCTVGGEITTVNAETTVTETIETYTWTAKAVGPDGKEYVDTKTFDRTTGEEITHEHVWSKPVWDWSGTTSKNAAARAIFTCSVNGVQPHSVEVKADITEVRTETTVTYTAKVTGPDNNEYTDVKVIDLATGKEITHEDHVWSKPTWDWKGTTSANGVAKATFNCTKAGEEHVVVLNATVTEKSRKANKVVYVATVSSPAPENKEYKDSCTVTWDENGEKVEPGKGGEDEVEILDGNYIIVGLSPEYGYTGAAIKPAIRLVDVNRDVVMAQGVDYTVKFKNNKKVGTASVTIKGKGNYAGTNAEASFKIVAPAAFCEIDSADLAAGKIKKVAVSDKSFVYNGAEQYPKSVTVTMKDKSVYTFTTEGDGEYTLEGDSDKTLAITYSNNKNKGTATIAATGADGKTKKASYKITAAPLAATMFEVEGTTWAVKAQEAKINGVFGEDELEIVAGQDFKAKYSAKNAGEKAGSVKITGKGNFKGKLTVNYDVEALEISEENIIVNAPAGKKVKVSVVDNAGNALNKKFFSFTSESSEGEVTVTVTAGPKAGSNVDFGEGVSASATSTSKNLGKVKIKVNSKAFSKYFTGEPVVLEEEDFAKIDTKGLVYGTDFEVASYKNNFKKGTMTVTLKGIGEYSGIKTIKVKIVGKPVDKVVEQ